MPKLRINLNRSFASFASFANFASFASFASFGSFAVSQFRSFDTIQWVSPFGIRPNRFRPATLGMIEEIREEDGYESSSIKERENKWLVDDDEVGDPEDFNGVSLADAYEDLNKISKPEQILWPSETYKEFMTAVTQYQLSDAAADSMLRII